MRKVRKSRAMALVYKLALMLSVTQQSTAFQPLFNGQGIFLEKQVNVNVSH